MSLRGIYTTEDLDQHDHKENAVKCCVISCRGQYIQQSFRFGRSAKLAKLSGGGVKMSSNPFSLGLPSP